MKKKVYRFYILDKRTGFAIVKRIERSSIKAELKKLLKEYIADDVELEKLKIKEMCEILNVSLNKKLVVDK